MDIIKWVCIAVIVFSIILLLFILIATVISGAYKICITTTGIKSMISFWTDYKYLFIVLFSAATLFVAVLNLRKIADTYSVSALSDIRAKLCRKELVDIHEFLLPESQETRSSSDEYKKQWEKIKATDLYDYLGTIELGVIMLQKGLISEEEFMDQFGYRVENIMADSHVMQHVNKNSKYYKSLLFAIEMARIVKK